MDAGQDLYQILGVLPTSDDVVIRGAYKALMLKYHPDTNRTKEGGERASAINAAYATLGDPERRAAYDRERRRRTSGRAKDDGYGFAEPGFAGTPSVDLASGRPVRPYGAIGFALLGACVVVGATTSMVASRSQTAQSPAAVSMASTEAAAARAPLTPGPVEAAAAGIPTDRQDLVDAFSGPASIPTEEAPQAAVDAAQEDQVQQTPVRDPISRDTVAPSINLAGVRETAREVDGILWSSGLGLAKAQSEICAEDVARRPSWAAADRCASFDRVVHVIDAQISEARGVAEDPYFRSRQDTAAELYRASNLGPYFTRQRLLRINRVADGYARQMIENQIAMRQRAQAAAATRQSASENAAGDMQEIPAAG